MCQNVTVAQTYKRWALDAPPAVESSVREWVFARLPPTIIDAHTHISGPGTFCGFSEFGWSHETLVLPAVDRPGQ